ncbi:hypothetical protein U3516DRAFT_741374 [Neocallimastix sp. 'constans']
MINSTIVIKYDKFELFLVGGSVSYVVFSYKILSWKHFKSCISKLRKYYKLKIQIMNYLEKTETIDVYTDNEASKSSIEADHLNDNNIYI